MMKSLAKLVSLVILVTVAGCARQGFPNGGPKDETPPKLLGTKPQNESRHFNAKEFYIQFDEYVVLKNADNNVLVSPPMKHKPEYTAKGKGVLVKLNDTLQENTTYLFQFKDAIADFTEGNLLPSYEYVFSTGDAMDTMMLAGQVLNAQSGKPWKETVTVMAYKVDEGGESAGTDTIGCSEQPSFVTRCDKEGMFSFHYIPEGRYRIVAMEDKNRNLRVGADEAVAWDTLTLASVADADSVPMPIYLISAPEKRQQRILKSEFTAKGRITIVTQLPMHQPMVEGEPAEWRLNERRDTLSLWCLNASCDSTRLIVSDEGLQDTLHLKYTEKKRTRRRIGKTTEQTNIPLVNPLCDGSKAFYDRLLLAFSNPIVKVADSIQATVMLMKDSTLTHCAVTVDSSGLIGRLETVLKSGENYKITLRDSLFCDLYGTWNDSLTFTLTPKDYGVLSIDITNLTGSPLVIEVLDKRDTVVQSSVLLSQSSNLRFSQLAAGDYRLRAVIDRNGDGRWTPGDYRQQRLPEEVVLFEKTLTLREKWEMEEKWTVEKAPRKQVVRKPVIRQIPGTFVIPTDGPIAPLSPVRK
ncbi:MAG: Ig-like domain-containing protein [Bacteroidales bacterium]|nr:Ig-like domain-containing protein [Bacteroidales bacterium]